MRGPHGLDQLLARAREVAISRDGLDLVRDVVAFQEGGQDATGAEGVRFERDEDQHGRGEGGVGSEELKVEVRDEVTREIHGRERDRENN